MKRKIVFIVNAVIILATLSFGEDKMLQVGSEAPDFELASHDSSLVKLSSYRGKKYIVLIFYPGDQTPGCTQQLCEIRDDYVAFEKRGALVFGINPASEKSHQKFAEKNELQFPLLIDSNGLVSKNYEAKGVLMNKRTVYVIDKEGKIIYAKRGKPPVADILSSLPQDSSSMGDLKFDLKD